MYVVYTPYFNCDCEDMNSWSTEEFCFLMQNENIKHNFTVYLFASAKVSPLIFLFFFFAAKKNIKGSIKSQFNICLMMLHLLSEPNQTMLSQISTVILFWGHLSLTIVCYFYEQLEFTAMDLKPSLLLCQQHPAMN